MIEKTTIRTTGVVLLIIANAVLMFSMLFSMYTGGSPQSGSGSGVVFVSFPEERFPDSEYRSLFSGLGLESSFITIDSSDEEKLVRRIQSFARRADLDRILLVSFGDSASLALDVAGREELIGGLILLMPRGAASDDSEVFTRWVDRKPIAIFDSDRPSTVSLYEILSGEDALLSDPLKGLVRISPDAKTYMSLRKLTGDPVLDDLIYPGLPDVQNRIASYITKYIFSEQAELSDVRGMILVRQILKIIPISLLIAGLFFFLSTISRPHSIRGVVPKESVREYTTPKELNLFSKLERSEKYLFALLVPVSLAYGVVLCILMVAVPRYAAFAAGLWPVLASIAAALFYFKHIKKMAAPEKPNRARFLLTVLVASLFTLGVFLVVSLHFVSFRYYAEFPRLLVFVALVGLLSLGRSACHKIDMFYTLSEKSIEHRRGFLSAWRFRGVLLIPFIAMLISAFLTLKPWLFLLAGYYIALLFAADWFRQRVKRMSGTIFLPAITAAVLYVILAFL